MGGIPRDLHELVAAVDGYPEIIEDPKNLLAIRSYFRVLELAYSLALYAELC